MVVGSRYNLNSEILDLRSNTNNNNVLPVFSQKCLGIYLDEKLDFDVQIEDVCKTFVLELVSLEELNLLFLKTVLNYINP